VRGEEVCQLLSQQLINIAILGYGIPSLPSLDLFVHGASPFNPFSLTSMEEGR
jgi:hypothetical protein